MSFTLKTITPQDGKILPMYENFYSVNFSLADLQGLGSGSSDVTVKVADFIKTEFITQIAILCNEVPDAVTPLDYFDVSVGSVTLSNKPVSLTTDLTLLGANDLIGGFTPTVGTTKGVAIATATKTTLLDSVSGNCTPQAVTSTTNGNFVTAVTGTGSTVQYGFNGSDAVSLGVEIKISGDTFNHMTAGNFSVYVWTKLIPSDFI